MEDWKWQIAASEFLDTDSISRHGYQNSVLAMLLKEHPERPSLLRGGNVFLITFSICTLICYKTSICGAVEMEWWSASL